MNILAKVGVFVIRRNAVGVGELLLFSHLDYPDVPYQIPGGGIEPREQPYAAALRELREEAGIAFLPLVRPLGVSEVLSDARPDTRLKRHCFLFDGTGLPEHWIHEVTGNGEDAGLRFGYRWHAVTSNFHLAGDTNHFLHGGSIPELYAAATASVRDLKSEAV